MQAKEGYRDETRRIGTGTGRGHPYIGIAQYMFWRIPDIAQFNPVYWVLFHELSPAAARPPRPAGQIWA